jgi:hypothetical protein
MERAKTAAESEHAEEVWKLTEVTGCNALAQVATHWHRLQRTGTGCNALAQVATHWHRLQRTGTGRHSAASAERAATRHVAPGMQQHVAPGMQRHVAPGMQRHVAPGMQRHVAPGMQRHVAPGMQRHLAPGMQRAGAATWHRKINKRATWYVRYARCGAPQSAVPSSMRASRGEPGPGADVAGTSCSWCRCVSGPGTDVAQVPVQMWHGRAVACCCRTCAIRSRNCRRRQRCTALHSWRLAACVRAVAAWGLAHGRVVLNIVRLASHARVNAPSRLLVQGRRLTTCTRLSCGMLHGADCMPLHIVPTVLPTPPGPSCGCFRMP